MPFSCTECDSAITATMAKPLADLRRMQRAQLNSIKKEDIIESILAASGNDDGSLGRVETRLDTLFQEMSALRKSVAASEDINSKKLKDMQE